jgi:hypothetical protein
VPSTFTFHGQVTGLEIARGHDGFLRGNPEPVIIFAAYLVTAGGLQIVGRSLHRFRASKPFPSAAKVDTPELPACRILLHAGATARWAVLAIALEEDGGEDVQRLFGAVEHHKNLSVWPSGAIDVEPQSLASVPFTDEWRLPREVDLLVDGLAASSSCRSDKWIGAVCWLMPGNETGMLAGYRLPFLAEDGRNDWTAIVAISH